MIGITSAHRTLTEFCTVTVYTDAKAADGSPDRSGTTVLFENLACKIVPLSARRGVEQGRIMGRATHTIFLPTHTTTGVAVTFGDDASISANGVTYRPTGLLRRQFAYGGALQTCDLEVKS